MDGIYEEINKFKKGIGGRRNKLLVFIHQQNEMLYETEPKIKIQEYSSSAGTEYSIK